MNTYYDVQKLLLKYGIITYLGDKEAEIQLSIIELKALYDEGILPEADYQRANLILRKERQDIQKER